jgi:LemA protein
VGRGFVLGRGRLMVFLIVVAIVAIVFIGIYNSLVRKKNQVGNIFATVDAILRKRYDLIPNVVATAQKYMQHEQNVLTEVTRLRAKALSGGTSDDEKIEIDKQISKAIRGILVAVENYPGLRANENFMHLQATLTEVEEQISAARRAYNASVTDYNNAVEMFPTNVVARLFDYRRKRLFEIEPGQREPVDVHALFQR